MRFFNGIFKEKEQEQLAPEAEVPVIEPLSTAQYSISSDPALFKMQPITLNPQLFETQLTLEQNTEYEIPANAALCCTVEQVPIRAPDQFLIQTPFDQTVTHVQPGEKGFVLRM